MTHDCPQFGRLFRPCRFEPRYDEPVAGGLFDLFKDKGSLATEFKVNGTVASIRDILPEQAVKKYVRDVCVRCGRTIERMK